VQAVAQRLTAAWSPACARVNFERAQVVLGLSAPRRHALPSRLRGLWGRGTPSCSRPLPKRSRAHTRRRMFIGQGGGKAAGGGMPQREQKAVLAAFRAGAFNTLVATCIGEEGLDIPQAPARPRG